MSTLFFSVWLLAQEGNMTTASQSSYKVTDDQQVIDEFTRTARALGLSRSAVVSVFMRRFNQVGGFPFDVRVGRHAVPIVPRRNADGVMVMPSDWDDPEDEGLYDDLG
jgi:antitoxin component of RelBE/YafQ-DinJ toxin-antitoxin module